MNSADAQIHIPPLTSTLNLAGHDVSRTSTDNSDDVVIFRWEDQGTTFLVRAKTATPVTVQDVEHMIASMLEQSGASATPSATTVAPASVPLSQSDAVWSKVVQTINGGIDPILRPSQLPDGFDTVKLVSITPADGPSAGPASFDVQYSGPNKQLDIVVGMMNTPLCGSGCTQSQITLRGQQATEQVNDAIPGHISLWWREPGTWAGTVDQRPWIEYYVFSQGLTTDEVEQVAASLVTVNE